MVDYHHRRSKLVHDFLADSWYLYLGLLVNEKKLDTKTGGAFKGQHFDKDLNFPESEEGPVTKKAYLVIAEDYGILLALVTLKKLLKPQFQHVRKKDQWEIHSV